jgi:hypothetical protein
MSAGWTLLIYMAADNDLEPLANANLKAMAKVELPPEVNVIVQVDRPSQVTNRYWIRSRKVELLDSMPGIDTGDPANLRAFIDWGTGTFPSRYTGLVVWNHGGGWDNPKVDDSAKRRLRRRPLPNNGTRLAIDDSAGDFLSDQEFREALETSAAGKVDILACDACLMGMLEIAYEMRNVATYFVASELIMPAPGWPYRAVLKELAERPDMSPRAFAQAIVETYAVHCDPKATATLAAVDLRRVEAWARGVDRVAREAGRLLKTEPNRQRVTEARKNMLETSDPEYLDFGDCLRTLARPFETDAAFMQAAKAALENFKAAVLAVGTTATAKNYSGWSIFFPKPEAKFLAAYGSLAFGQRHRWGGFLRAFLGASEARPRVRAARAP